MANKYGRHGLVQSIDRYEFVEFARKNRSKVIAKEYGISRFTVPSWKKRFGMTCGYSVPREITWDIGNNGCWICTSHGFSNHGYPSGKKSIGRWSIARVMYEKEFGEIKKGLVMRHKCDNRACINPSHLETGTQRDNLRDMFVRKRHSFGVRHGNAKLTDEDVLFAKELKLCGGSYSCIGGILGVSGSGTIWPALNGKTWKHVWVG
jgi:hypothetical protein